MRINAGGAYTDTQGQQWEAASGFAGAGGVYGPVAETIAGTLDDPLYQHERWGATFTWNRAVPNGQYQVTLKFAEIFYPTPGSRTFDVLIEGALVLNDWEPLDEVGPFTALDKTFTTSVQDGSLNVSFLSSQDNAKVNSIQVVAVAPPTLTPTPVGPTATNTPGSSPTPTQTPLPGTLDVEMSKEGNVPLFGTPLNEQEFERIGWQEPSGRELGIRPAGLARRKVRRQPA